MLYKVWEYHNKFGFMKSLGVYYWYVKMPQCGCVEHGLEYITFYVEKHIEYKAACSGPLLVRNGPLEASAFVKLAQLVVTLWWVRTAVWSSDVQHFVSWVKLRLNSNDHTCMPPSRLTCKGYVFERHVNFGNGGQYIFLDITFQSTSPIISNYSNR